MFMNIICFQSWLIASIHWQFSQPAVYIFHFCSETPIKMSSSFHWKCFQFQSLKSWQANTKYLFPDSRKIFRVVIRKYLGGPLAECGHVAINPL